ncbi:MAG: hypothetical protein CMC96_03770 [Flavobacteriales bacterium]|nr:hypothetical protein [Flavobacteriales bacterium]|tara:strand:+ start:261 stop:1052 length:792 start_codon:yes stop_codon:yes gene_type:complete
MTLKTKLLVLTFHCLFTFVNAQKVTIFSDQYLPAKPYGGKDEVQLLFNNALEYPEEAIQNKIEGDVFINYQVNTNGELVKIEFDQESPEVLQKAALDVFKRILWEKHPNEPKSRLSDEKIKVSFRIKKYNKLVKKRGYKSLSELTPYGVDSTLKVYNINQVDEKVGVKNASSVNDFVAQNFKFPGIALERGISGRVSVEFVIEPYGFISNVRITEPLAGGCNDETVRLMRTIKWEAAKVDGKAVRTLYRYQLNFINPGGSLSK